MKKKEKSPPKKSQGEGCGTGSLNNNLRENIKNICNFDFFLYGRWEDLDRWKWVVIDVGVISDTSASHSENFFVSFMFLGSCLAPDVSQYMAECI